MANDGGLCAKLEDWIAARLALLEYSGAKVFRTAEPFRWQIQASGPEAFLRYAPFAFVGWKPQSPDREGGNDLRGRPQFHVLIGTVSEAAGEARRGSAGRLGASKLRDLAIACLDQENPGAGYDIDDLLLVDEYDVDEGPKHFAFALVFETSQLKWSE